MRVTLYFILLYLPNGFEAQLVERLAQLMRDDRHDHGGVLFVDVIELELADGSKENIQTFILDNTNRYFTKKDKSEDKESHIGLRLIESEDQQLLDLYILDHTSRFFMPELEATGKYAPEKPVAASPGLYLNLIFTKE